MALHPKTKAAPVFTVPLNSVGELREGDSVRFEARLTPTDDPKLKVEWYWNGQPMKAGSRFRTLADFGFVVLEISPVYPEDSGQFACRAYNDYGEAITTTSMSVTGQQSIIREAQVPRGTIEKIAELESHAPTDEPPEQDLGRAPAFVSTPSDLSLPENSAARFECRVTPTDDPALRIEWFHNGQALSAGSRIETMHDFGFVILEIHDVYIRDSGLYTCKATNKHGQAATTCQLSVTGRQGIDVQPQVSSQASQTIQRMEEAMQRRDEVRPEEEKQIPPVFTSQIKDNLDVPEGGKVHFDCRLEPRTDPSMRIDWLFNGQPFPTAARVKSSYDFGFISLDIDCVYPRDSGEYVCRASNRWGTATTRAQVTCIAKQGIVTASQLPDLMAAEKIRQLDNLKKYTRAEPDDAIPAEPPRFLADIQPVTVPEEEPVRFETRVEPKNDPHLKIEWYRNGKLLPVGSRIHPMFELGFVALEFDYVYMEDQGEYVCRAYNDHGEAFTKATIACFIP